MKKVLGLLIGFIITWNTVVFAASEPQVSFTIDGKAKKGEKITINVMAKDVTNLYAASVDYFYDPELIKVNSIVGANLITDSKDNKMELGGETAKDGNRANYQMTFTGKVNGVKGSGNIVKIEAEILKDCVIELTETNMKVKLVQVDKDYNVSNMNFSFKNFKTEGDATTEKSVKPEVPGNTEKPEDGQESGDVDNNNNNGETTTEEKPSKLSLVDKITGIFNKKPVDESSLNSSGSSNNNQNDNDNGKDNSEKDNTENGNDSSDKYEKQETTKFKKIGIGIGGVSLLGLIVGGSYIIINKQDKK